MSVFLSPGVFINESDLSILPSGVGQLRPAFFGTAKRGPMNVPTLITNAAQAIDTFGEPFPESYLMYAVLAYLEQGNQCYITRVGVECEPGQPTDLSDVCIDTSGAKVQGWGRIPIFSGIDFGRINLRAPTAAAPFRFTAASVANVEYNQAALSSTHGPTSATATVTGTFNGNAADSFTVLILGNSTGTAGEEMTGSSYEVIRNSDGVVVADGVLAETGTGGDGSSQPIALGNGLQVHLHVTAGQLAVNDTFTFNVVPDNRSFAFAIEGLFNAEYVMPTATYTTVGDFVIAFNALLHSESFQAISHTQSDGTVIPQIVTTQPGYWIQLAKTEAWALEVGQSQYAYDIPRSYLSGVQAGPYNVQSRNNQITLNVIGPTATRQIKFSIATGINLSCAQLAANIQPAGAVPGGRAFDAYALNVPGGDQHLFLIVSLNNEFDQLQLLATYTFLKVLRFSETVGISYPYKRGYRGFQDGRSSLPLGSEADQTIPLSCELNQLGGACASDTAYYANVVGWLMATSPGSWINKYTIALEIFTQGVGEAAGRYQITVKDQNNVAVDVIQDVSFDQTQDRYIANLLNPGTKFGGRNGNAYLNWEPRPTYLNNDPTATNYAVRQPSVFSGMPFIGAANGIPLDPIFSSELDAAVIGNPALGTGVFAMQNPETYDINLLLTPGFSSGAVIGQCLQMCESRGDVLYLVDPPFGLRPQQAVDWHNGMLLSDLTAAIDSSYGGLYWSWIEVYDQFNNINVWMPPSGHVAGVFSLTSQVAEQWSAPAGLNRGRLLTALDVEYSPSQGERNLLYGSGNAVNPIVNFPQDGITVWGQRTLQRRQSALDRVSVRMLLIYLKKNLTRLLRAFIFEPNDSILWAQVSNTLNPFLADVQARRGVRAFQVVCNNTNNTPERVDRNELWVSVFIQPERTTEFVAINLVVLSTSASFTASEVLAAGGVVNG